MSTEATKTIPHKDHSSRSLPKDYYIPLISPASSTRSPQSTLQLEILSFGLGILIGVFMQLSTLGMNFLATVMLKKDQLGHYEGILSFSLCLLSLSMALFMLRLLNRLYRTLLLFFAQGEEIRLDEDSVRGKLIALMEARFISGTVVGVSLSWIATDCLFSFKYQLTFSITSSIVVLSVYLLICYIYDGRNINPIHATDDHRDEDIMV